MPNFATVEQAPVKQAFNYGYNAEEVLFMGKSINRNKLLDILRISQDIDRIEFFDPSILSGRLIEIVRLTQFRSSHSNQRQRANGNYRLNSTQSSLNDHELLSYSNNPMSSRIRPSRTRPRFRAQHHQQSRFRPSTHYSRNRAFNYAEENES